MCRTTLLHNNRAFSVAEVLTATLVALYIIFGAWSIYLIGWAWWHEINPTIEAQRVVRQTLSSVVEGTIDSTAGQDTIGASTYRRRNGIQGVLFDANNPTPTTPVISSDRRRIDFRLEDDIVNARAFYFNALELVVYYVNNNAVRRLKATQGLTDLSFDFYTDRGGITHYDIIQITATVSKDVVGTRNVPYHIEVTDKQIVYLRNTLL